MNSLQKLVAMQKANKTGVNNGPATQDKSSVRVAHDPESLEGVRDDAPEPATEQAADAGAADGAAAPAKSLGLSGKLNLLGKSGGGGGTGGSNVRSDSAARVREPVSTGNDAGTIGSSEFSLDDLAGFDESVTPVVESREGGMSAFLDEIEATAPDRDLPADLESAQLMFVEQLDGIYQVLNDPEMFGQSVRVIMMELQENPEYIKLISDQDVHTMIRAMRNTMGLARIKKQAKSRKSTGTARAKKAGAVSDDVMNLLDSLGGMDDD